MADRRLFDVEATAVYLGEVSDAFVRGLVRQHLLIPVQLPSSRGTGVNRRLLFDVRDLDALIDQWKAGSTGEPNAQLSEASLKGWRQSPVRRKGAAA